MFKTAAPIALLLLLATPAFASDSVDGRWLIPSKVQANAKGLRFTAEYEPGAVTSDLARPWLKLNGRYWDVVLRDDGSGTWSHVDEDVEIVIRPDRKGTSKRRMWVRVAGDFSGIDSLSVEMFRSTGFFADLKRGRAVEIEPWIRARLVRYKAREWGDRASVKMVFELLAAPSLDGSVFIAIRGVHSEAVSGDWGKRGKTVRQLRDRDGPLRRLRLDARRRQLVIELAGPELAGLTAEDEVGIDLRVPLETHTHFAFLRFSAAGKPGKRKY